MPAPRSPRLRRAPHPSLVPLGPWPARGWPVRARPARGCAARHSPAASIAHTLIALTPTRTSPPDSTHPPTACTSYPPTACTAYLPTACTAYPPTACTSYPRPDMHLIPSPWHAPHGTPSRHALALHLPLPLRLPSPPVHPLSSPPPTSHPPTSQPPASHLLAFSPLPLPAYACPAFPVCVPRRRLARHLSSFWADEPILPSRDHPHPGTSSL